MLPIFDGMKSDYTQLSYFRSNFNLIEPVEIILGNDEYGKVETFHYIPVNEVLISLLQHDDKYFQR